MSPRTLKGLTLLLVSALAASACGDEPESAPEAADPLSCVVGSFALKKLSLPEASGAA